MHYIDTSVLMAYLVPEKYSTQAEEALRNPAHYPLALSTWTKTELVSAFGIKCRTGQISEDQMLDALAQYEMLSGYFVHIQVLDEDYKSAMNFLKNWRIGLRAGDALHLAVTQRHSCVILSLDERLVKAGAHLGITTKYLRSDSTL
ncbi:PIN domain-containing protein [Gammaproteobacteria bacterium]